MFADPQEVTIDSVEKTLPRVKQEPTKATYATSDELWSLTISHLRGGNRTRTMARLDQRAIVADPLGGPNDFDTVGVYLVIDRPDFGFSNAQVSQIVAGLTGWLAGDGVVNKLFGRET